MKFLSAKKKWDR